MKTTRIAINGMHCASCAALIENKLKESVTKQELYTNYSISVRPLNKKKRASWQDKRILDAIS